MGLKDKQPLSNNLSDDEELFFDSGDEFGGFDDGDEEEIDLNSDYSTSNYTPDYQYQSDTLEQPEQPEQPEQLEQSEPAYNYDDGYSPESYQYSNESTLDENYNPYSASSDKLESNNEYTSSYDENIETVAPDTSSYESENTGENEVDYTIPTLYVLIDRENLLLLDYMRESGLAVQRIYTDISEMKSMLIAQFDPCQVIILDTGTGRFGATAARKELTEICSVANESIEIFVFYTDSAIMLDVQSVIGRNKVGIKWTPYKNTIVTTAEMLTLKKQYRYSNSNFEESDLEVRRKAELTKGFNSNIELGEPMILPGLSNKVIVQNIQDTNFETVPGFQLNTSKWV